MVDRRVQIKQPKQPRPFARKARIVDASSVFYGRLPANPAQTDLSIADNVRENSVRIWTAQTMDSELTFSPGYSQDRKAFNVQFDEKVLTSNRDPESLFAAQTQMIRLKANKQFFKENTVSRYSQTPAYLRGVSINTYNEKFWEEFITGERPRDVPKEERSREEPTQRENETDRHLGREKELESQREGALERQRRARELYERKAREAERRRAAIRAEQAEQARQRETAQRRERLERDEGTRKMWAALGDVFHRANNPGNRSAPPTRSLSRFDVSRTTRTRNDPFNTRFRVE